MATNSKSFSKKEALRFGWKTTLKNLAFLVGVTVVVGIVQFIPNLLESYVEDQKALEVVLNIVVYVLSIGLTLGSIKIYLSFVDNKTPQFSDLFSLFEARLLWRYFLTSLIYGFAVLFGFILLIIPGIYIAIKYGFYTYILVDKRVGVFESLVLSGQITKNRIWELFLYHLLLFFVVVAGVLALVVGLLVALPTASLATTYIYRKLVNTSKVK